jgi:hypothetical protein
MTDFRHSFQYYAMRYLLLWEQAERSIFERFSASNTPTALRKAMHHFRISRSFAGVADDARATLILRAIAQATSKSPAENVHALALRFKDDFESFNLSAASKLLWWKHKSPYLIYDSQAVKTLRKLKFQFENRDYSSYEVAWRSAYDRYSGQIDLAAASLIAMRPFVAHWHPTATSISELATQAWFKERIFDMALWENGNDG